MSKYFYLLTLVVFMYSCKSDFQIEEPNSINQTTKNARQAIDEGILVDITYLEQKIRVIKKNGLYYFNSDQIIPNKLVTSETPVLLPKMQLSGTYATYKAIPWPGNVVNYVMEGGSGVQALGPKVDKAVAEWNSKNTYIKFQRYSAGQSNLSPYPTKGLLVFDLSPTNTGNSTYGLGYPGDDRENLKVTLTQDVSNTTILHEMMHVVGIGHEHQRGIRNQYIGINQSLASTYNYDSNTLITQILNTHDRAIFNAKKVDNFLFDYNSITIYNLPGLIYSLNSSKSIERKSTLTEKDINLVRTIADYNAEAELRLRNIDYAKLQVPVYFEGGKKIIFFLVSGKDLVFTYNPDKQRYTLNGLVVDYVDLNNGDSSDDIKFTAYANRITYKPNKSGDYWIINNYNNRIVDNNKYSPPFNQETTDFDDNDGIAGKGAARLNVYSVMPDESYGFRTYITIRKK